MLSKPKIKNSKQEFLKALKEQFKIEKQSRDKYRSLIKKIDDKKIVDKVKIIIKAEIRHMKIVDDMIYITNGYKIPLKEKNKKVGKNILFNKIDSANSLLLISDVEKYIHDIINIFNYLKDFNLVYVSFNKISKFAKKILKEHNFNIKKITFINCIGMSDGNDINVNPADLTELAIQINTLMKKKNTCILVDTISAFTVFHNNQMISSFVGGINDKARITDTKIIWVAFGDKEEEVLNKMLLQICDEKIGH